MIVNDGDRPLLLGWVRLVIECHLKGTVPEAPDLSDYPSCGAFVTIHKNGSLRGCIGYTISQDPLEDTLRDAALSAAFRDPRFPPLQEEELPEIDLEISLLSPPEPVDSPEELELGRHGALLKSGFHAGLFLPQVATEQDWNLEQFMTHLCLKAGLAPDHWKTGEYSLFRFTAAILSEKESSGSL